MRASAATRRPPTTNTRRCSRRHALQQADSYVDFDPEFATLPVVQNAKTLKTFLRNAPASFIVKYRNPNARAHGARGAARDAARRVARRRRMAARLHVAEATLRRSCQEGHAYQSIRTRYGAISRSRRWPTPGARSPTSRPPPDSRNRARSTARSANGAGAARPTTATKCSHGAAARASRPARPSLRALCRNRLIFKHQAAGLSASRTARGRAPPGRRDALSSSRAVAGACHARRPPSSPAVRAGRAPRCSRRCSSYAPRSPRPAHRSPAAARPAVVIPINGAIGPASADFIVRSLDRAARQHAPLAILQLGTPGGLDTSMRQIIKSHPRLARAGRRVRCAGRRARRARAPTSSMPATSRRWRPAPISARRRPCSSASAAPRHRAGILRHRGCRPAPPGASGASDAAASQAALPTDTQSTEIRKAMQDASAYIRGLAQLRGRNAEWAEARGARP